MRQPSVRFVINVQLIMLLIILHFDFSGPTASTSSGLHPTESNQLKVEIKRVHDILKKGEKSSAPDIVPEPIVAEVLPSTDPHTVLLSQMRSTFR